MYDVYDDKERKVWLENDMHERELTINSQGDTERVPYPLENNPLIIGQIKRPLIESYEQGLEWNKQAQEHADKAISFTQEVGEVKLEPRGNKALLVNVSDTHWGHYDTDYDSVDRLFNLIENTPDAYAVVGWNLLDAAIPAQFPDGVMWSGQTAQEQVYTFRDKLQKLYKMNKLLGGIGDGSCHEGWIKKKTGWAIYRELFDGIDVPLILNGGYMNVSVKNESYRLALFHKTPYWSQFNKTHGGDRVMDRVVDAEIVFTSHFHQAAVGRSNRYNFPYKKDTAVVSSGTCKTHDKWARNNFGKDGEPVGQGIILWANRHTFEVVYDLENGSELMKQ
jgi:hypothetical protein